MTKKIKLKKDTQMFTGYQGRGIPMESKIYPAGTEVIYNKQVTLSGTYHTVHLFENGVRWEASKKKELKEKV